MEAHPSSRNIPASLAPLPFHILCKDLDRSKASLFAAFFRRARHVAELQSCLSLCYGRNRFVAGPEDRVEMDRVQLVSGFDNTIGFLISDVPNNRTALETTL
jgi:hypothetical protein